MPAKTTHRFLTVKVDDPLYQAAKDAAKAQDLTVSQMVRRALRRELLPLEQDQAA